MKLQNFRSRHGCYHCPARVFAGKVQRMNSSRSSERRTRGHPMNSRRHLGLRVKALDAAMPFDFEHKATRNLKQQNSLRVAIIGFGNFGQFLAKRLVAAGHQVTATSKRDYSIEAQNLGVIFFQDVDDLCEDHPDVVILATSILSTKSVVKSLPVQRLRRSTLIVDVLSVKSFPKQLMLSELPEEMDVLCTHPMFGPDSGKGSWKGLNLMYEKVRVGSDQRRQKRADSFLKFFGNEGCNMVEMTCEQHDEISAETQFTTHLVGRTLGRMSLTQTAIDTKGYEALLRLVENTNNDSFELFYGLFMYNENAVVIMNRFERAVSAVRQELMLKTHKVAKEQLFEGLPKEAVEQIPAAKEILPKSESQEKRIETSKNGSSPVHNSVK